MYKKDKHLLVLAYRKRPCVSVSRLANIPPFGPLFKCLDIT